MKQLKKSKIKTSKIIINILEDDEEEIKQREFIKAMKEKIIINKKK